jgi:hypothetical protein
LPVESKAWMKRPYVAAIAAAIVAAGCATSTTSQLNPRAAARLGGKSAHCWKAGLTIFVGRRETVYECRIFGVPGTKMPDSIAEADLRFPELSFVRCFVS